MITGQDCVDWIRIFSVEAKDLPKTTEIERSRERKGKTFYIVDVWFVQRL